MSENVEVVSQLFEIEKHFLKYKARVLPQDKNHEVVRELTDSLLKVAKEVIGLLEYESKIPSIKYQALLFDCIHVNKRFIRFEGLETRVDKELLIYFNGILEILQVFLDELEKVSK